MVRFMTVRCLSWQVHVISLPGTNLYSREWSTNVFTPILFLLCARSLHLPATGYHLGEHKLIFGKGQPYEPSVRLPMYIRGPGVPQGVISKLPTTHLDIIAVRAVHENTLHPSLVMSRGSFSRGFVPSLSWHTVSIFMNENACLLKQQTSYFCSCLPCGVFRVYEMYAHRLSWS